MNKRNVVFGLLDPYWDCNVDHPGTGFWRPSVSAVSSADFSVHRFELLIQDNVRAGLAEEVIAAMQAASPATEIHPRQHLFSDPWDFEEIYAYLHDQLIDYPFNLEEEDYFVHMSTGTHVMHICLFLLTESRILPGKMLQTYPAGTYGENSQRQAGVRVIDLDLGRYDLLAKRFAARGEQGSDFLKSGIATRNAAFNEMIAEIEQVAINSQHPILLTGPTGAGKSQLAQRIYELKHQRHLINGPFVPVNCATLYGENAMSTLFGHRKGSFTGATSDRAGLLRRAQRGMLFLDEIGELGANEQAMLLRALETGRYYPLGADEEEGSRFQLIAGTNRDLQQEVKNGRFRADLLARINLWAYQLPGLKQRLEDIEPNIDFELGKFARHNGKQISFNREARKRFLAFACAADASWQGNFRDLNACITRMATLAPGGRIGEDVLEREIRRLQAAWQIDNTPTACDTLQALLSPEQLAEIDLFDRPQLAYVIETCRASTSIAEAGRRLFQASRLQRSKVNDSDRVRKYLARFGLDWAGIKRK